MKTGLSFRYWILPLLVLVPLIIMYFSGVEWARNIVCPPVNWELGIVENLQLALLLMIFIIASIAVKRKVNAIERIVFILLSVFTLFVFFEEIDYGTHFLKYFKNQDNTLFSDLTGQANIHNEGNNAKLFKRSIYPLMAALFIIAPLLKDRVKRPLIRYLIPAREIIITAIITIFSYIIPRLLVELNILKDGGFGVNIGEFSEVMVYYIFFLYLYEIIFEKDLLPAYKNKS